MAQESTAGNNRRIVRSSPVDNIIEHGQDPVVFQGVVTRKERSMSWCMAASAIR
jgi:hypothetical protein